ncbi:ADP,ATP carrier protein [Ancistrocladus abbreviatus]
MALKAVIALGFAISHLGNDDLGSRRIGFTHTIGIGKYNHRLPICPVYCTVRPEEEEKSGSNLSKRSQKDLSSLPKPLSVTDFSASPSGGSKVLIAFKGIPGAYSEDAALKAYPQCETVPCDEFEDTFKAVELLLADKAVLPIENSLGGSIHRNYDLLLRHRLHIVGEVQLPVNFCLLALPGVRAEQLKRVLSHPQALAQSDLLLNKLGVVRENVDDTAAAAQFVASNHLQDAGVIASARAGELYGLNILAARIQDDPDSITRFLVLARDPIIPRTDKPFKTSVVFTLEEGPGVLFKALAVFALREINLTKMESRPQRKRPLRVVDDSDTGSAKYFDYLFYIDFEASMAEPRAQNALAHLQEFATFLRILGCYPIDIS